MVEDNEITKYVDGKQRNVILNSIRWINHTSNTRKYILLLTITCQNEKWTVIRGLNQHWIGTVRFCCDKFLQKFITKSSSHIKHLVNSTYVYKI